MKSILGTLAGIAACVALASPALADDGSGGPFATVGDLINFWFNPPHPQSYEIYVNGHKVFEVAGNGQHLVRQYFVCSDGSGIKPYCNTGATTGLALAYATQDGYVGYLDAYHVVGNGTTAYLDGVQIPNTSGKGLLLLETCRGDASWFGSVRYYVVQYLFDGFGPAFNHDCFQ